jgi:hypothetical protein
VSPGALLYCFFFRFGVPFRGNAEAADGFSSGGAESGNVAGASNDDSLITPMISLSVSLVFLA